MNKELLKKQVEVDLEHYFECARKQKCPARMKQSLYQKISINTKKPWFNSKLAMAGLSLVFIGAVTFKITSLNDNRSEINLEHAKVELQVAMYYMNQVSLKSLTEVTNKGIKPGLIRPMAISMASL